jgi:hypothetical protein
MYALGPPPMGLGEVLDGKDPDGNLTNEDKLGLVYAFPGYPLTGGPNRQKSLKTGKPIIAILLRNTSGLTLLGKRFGQLDRTAGYTMTKEVNGYSTTLGNKGVVLIDPFLPSTGVADDDIFWGVIAGAVTVLLPLTDSGHVDIAVNDPLVGHTGTTTGATTSGRVTKVQFANATAGGTEAALSGFNMAYGCVGRALSARTSQETTAGADILVDLDIKVFSAIR